MILESDIDGSSCGDRSVMSDDPKTIPHLLGGVVDFGGILGVSRDDKTTDGSRAKVCHGDDVFQQASAAVERGSIGNQKGRL